MAYLTSVCRIDQVEAPTHRCGDDGDVTNNPDDLYARSASRLAGSPADPSLAAQGDLFGATHDFDDGCGAVRAHRHPNGGGWVADTAHADTDAFVGPEASVFDRAQILGNASVSGSAWVRGDAVLSGSASVAGDAVVEGNARVSGDAEIMDNAYVSGDVEVGGVSKVAGDARLGDPMIDQDDATYVDRDGVDWWWDGSCWNCWISDEWTRIPGARPDGLVLVVEPAEMQTSGEGTPVGSSVPRPNSELQEPYRPVNPCAIVSLVFAIAFPLPLAALAFGAIANTQIKEAGGRERGQVMAAWGMALGVLELLAILMLVIASGNH